MGRILFSLGIVLALIAAPSFARSSLDFEEHLSLPKDLSFAGKTVEIQNPLWFANFFNTFNTGCADHLAAKDTSGRVEIAAAGPNTLAIQFNRKISHLALNAKTTYVPVHYEQGQMIHPYFLVETQAGWKFHVVIHRTDGLKNLSVYLLKGRPGNQTLVPIFTAFGA